MLTKVNKNMEYINKDLEVYGTKIAIYFQKNRLP